VPIRTKACLCEYKENPSCVDKDGFQLEGYYIVELNDACPKHHNIYVYMAVHKHSRQLSIELLRELEYKEARGEQFITKPKSRLDLIMDD
jgi:hypothetical protein